MKSLIFIAFFFIIHPSHAQNNCSDLFTAPVGTPANGITFELLSKGAFLFQSPRGVLHVQTPNGEIKIPVKADLSGVDLSPLEVRTNKDMSLLMINGVDNIGQNVVKVPDEAFPHYEYRKSTLILMKALFYPEGYWQAPNSGLFNQHYTIYSFPIFDAKGQFVNLLGAGEYFPDQTDALLEWMSNNANSPDIDIRKMSYIRVSYMSGQMYQIDVTAYWKGLLNAVQYSDRFTMEALHLQGELGFETRVLGARDGTALLLDRRSGNLSVLVDGVRTAAGTIQLKDIDLQNVRMYSQGDSWTYRIPYWQPSGTYSHPDNPFQYNKVTSDEIPAGNVVGPYISGQDRGGADLFSPPGRYPSSIWITVNKQTKQVTFQGWVM